MKYRVVHRTHYGYSRPVSVCHNMAHLKPRTFLHQRCLGTSINVSPAPAVMTEWEDFFGNPSAYFAVQVPHDALTVTAVSEVEVGVPTAVPVTVAATTWEQVRGALGGAAGPEAEALEARQYVLESPFVIMSPALATYAQPSFSAGRPLLEAVVELMQRIHADFSYDPHFSTIATPLEDVLAHRRGVCQDFAHLAIGCLRAHGLAARYVSGYLETEPPPGAERLVGADASHAWFSVWLPGHGWVDFDPTNNQLPMERHIVTAWGRDYGDITPLKGVIFGGGEEHTLDVAVDVERING